MTETRHKGMKRINWTHESIKRLINRGDVALNVRTETVLKCPFTNWIRCGDTLVFITSAYTTEPIKERITLKENWCYCTKCGLRSPTLKSMIEVIEVMQEMREKFN